MSDLWSCCSLNEDFGTNAGVLSRDEHGRIEEHAFGGGILEEERATAGLGHAFDAAHLVIPVVKQGIIIQLV